MNRVNDGPLSSGVKCDRVASAKEKEMENRIGQDRSDDGVDRRGFLRCMAWAGTGMVWAVSGGILGCNRLGKDSAETQDAAKSKGGTGRPQISITCHAAAGSEARPHGRGYRIANAVVGASWFWATRGRQLRRPYRPALVSSRAT